MAITISATTSPLRDQFRLVRVVGSTESTDEYLAVDRTSGQEALVQVIRPGAVPTVDAREAVLGRLMSAALFERPGILPIRQVSLDDERVVVVRDWPAGPSLATTLANGPSPVAWSAAVVADALRAVEAAAGANVAHPGLTPSNIFVAPDGRVQVSDFGLPLLPAASVLPTTGESEGAPPMAVVVRAPELVVGRAADLPAQQYAAAAIFVWLVTGQPPFAGETIAALREQQASARPRFDSVAGLPEALATLIRRSLAFSPEERAGALSELLRALDAVRPKATPRVAATRPRRWVWLAGAATAASVAALAVFAGLQAARLTDETSAAAKPATGSAVEVTAAKPVTGDGVLSASPPPAPAPSAADLALARAHACWGQDWPCTIEALTALATVRPGDREVDAQLATAYVNRGRALAAIGDINGAHAAFAAARTARPDDPQAHLWSELAETYLVGAAAYDAADWATAIRSFERVASTDPAFGEAGRLLTASLTNGGLQALRDGDLGRASALCSDAQRLGGETSACLESVRAFTAPRPQSTVTRPVPPPVVANAPVTTPAPPIVRTVNTPRLRTTWLP